MNKEQYKIYRRNQRICYDNDYGFPDIYNIKTGEVKPNPYWQQVPLERDWYGRIFRADWSPENILEQFKKGIGNGQVSKQQLLEYIHREIKSNLRHRRGPE